MPFRIGPAELIIVLVIVMLIFGAGRLPDIAEAVGKGIQAFRRSVRDADDAFADPDRDEPTSRPNGGPAQ